MFRNNSDKRVQQKHDLVADSNTTATWLSSMCGTITLQQSTDLFTWRVKTKIPTEMKLSD